MTLNYEQFDCPQSDSPWVVLIHGLFGDMDNLAALRRHLQPQFNLLTVDLPDHGKSPWVSPFTLSDCVTGIIALLDEKSINKAHIVGHSLGGKVAMMTALTHPERVNNLVPMDIAPVSYPPHHQTIFAGLKKVDLASITGRKDADKAMQSDIPVAGVRQFLLKSLYQHENGQWQWRFNLAGLEADYANVGGFTAPEGAVFTGNTTFIKGGESDYIKREHQSLIGQLFPNAKAKIVEGVGHWLHAEKPQVVNGLVERALLA